MPPTITDIVALDLPAFVIGIGIHEFCHAWCASALGDPTPREQGRVSLNPLRHLTLLGTLFPLILPMLGSQVSFGWGKPVIINPDNFQNKRYYGLVAMAGPCGNLLVLLLIGLFLRQVPEMPSVLKLLSKPNVNFLFRLLFRIYALNLGLFLFNLIPIPPLDGSKMLVSIGGSSMKRFMERLANFNLPIFIILVYSGIDRVVLAPAFVKCTVLITGEFSEYIFSPAKFVLDFL